MSSSARTPPHRGTAASWAVLDAARRLGWWVDPLLGAAPETGRATDPEQVDRALARVGATPPGPGILGLLHEALLHPDDRVAGAHYTPADVARRLSAEAIGGLDPCDGARTPRVWDPTCGGGAFLLAAADVLHDLGHDPSKVVAEMLWGTDIDPGAVAVTDASLRWWAQAHGAPGSGPGRHLDVADVFLAGCPVPGGCDAVVGNPPFQGQMRGASVRTPAQTRELRERWGDVVGPYTDTAALALVVGADALRPGGRLAMVLPASVLGARDATAARDAATAEAGLAGLWVAVDPVFDAEVDVCALVLGASTSTANRRPDPVTVAPPPPVHRWSGRAFHQLPDAEAPGPGRSWAPLAAAALGVPEPGVRTRGTIGDVAEVSAGFRDEYYGLVGHVREAPEGFRLDRLDRSTGPDGQDEDDRDASTGLVPLITSGLIEPGRALWGERHVRFARVEYVRPVVDLRSLHEAGGRASARVASLAVPKLLVATQTRVGEAAVDEHGWWVASTPTVTAVAPVEVLWRLAAVVCSPVGSALAAARTAGTGRATRSIKHSATSVRDLPLPVDSDAWSAGVQALRLGRQHDFAAAMGDAYGVVGTEELTSWWLASATWSR